MDRGLSLGEIVTRANGFVLPQAKGSMWTYQPDDFVRTFDMQAVLNRLLDPLEPAEADLSAVRKDFGLDAHITLNVQMDDDVTPDGTLLAPTLARLVALRIDLDLDLYTQQGV
jgi:hypothetical protein